MTPSATKLAAGRRGLTRDDIRRYLRRYAELFGDDFTIAAFSPSQAKWRDEPELIERYYAGDPETGEPWPSLNAIKSKYDGSFNAAKEDAGLPVSKPGPGKRRAAGQHRPIRDVSHVEATRIVYIEKDRDEGEVARLTRRAERAEARADRLTEALERSRASKRARTVTKTKTKVVRERVRVEDSRALERARQRVRSADERLKEAKVAARAELAAAEKRAKEARDHAARAASKLERSEATISELREDRRELRDEIGRLSDRLTVAERELADAVADAAALADAAVKPTVIREEAPEKAVLDDAKRRAHDAELRAARMERELLDHVAAIKGERRRLTNSELAELRRAGPQGEPVLAAALRKLAVARKSGTGPEVKAALHDVAAAAVSWEDRL